MLHPGIEPPRADRLVERILADRAEALAIAGAEAVDRGRIEGDLADRLQHEAVEPPGAALAHRVEAADLLDLVAEEIDPERRRSTRREQVDDAAADRELARFAHRLGPDIAVVRDEPDQRRRRQRLAARDCQDRLAIGGARRHPLEDGGDGGDDQPGLGIGSRRQELRQRIDPLAHQVAVRRHPVIGQAVPGGEGQDLDGRREEAQPVGELRHAGIVAHHVQQLGMAHGRQRRGQPPEQQRVISLGRPADDRASEAGQKQALQVQARADEQCRALLFSAMGAGGVKRFSRPRR